MKTYSQAGFTLAELMISAALATIIIAAVLVNYQATKKTYQLADNVMSFQESSQFISHYLNNAIQHAGDFGCSNRVRVKLNNPDFFNLLLAVTGHEYKNTDHGKSYSLLEPPKIENNINWNNNLDSLIKGKTTTGNDILIVKSLIKTAISLTDNNSKTSHSLNISNPHKLYNNSLLLVGDCVQSEFFKHTSGTHELVATIGSSPSDNKFLNDSIWGRNYGHDSSVYLAAITYFYIGIGSGGQPSLFRTTKQASDKPALTEELLEGVEVMQLTYGVDTDNDGITNILRTADHVEDWSQVVRVQAGFIIRSLNTSNDLPQTTPLTLLGNIQFTAKPDTKYLRKSVNLTINANNLGLLKKTVFCHADEITTNLCFEL